MDDLISRQAAIDAILHNQEVYSNNFGTDAIDKYTIAIIDNDAQTIAQLPSAQPDAPTHGSISAKTVQKQCNRTIDDCISRQAAIDALGDEPEVWTGKDEYAQGLNNQWNYDRNAILALPSAQPEILRCKDCKHWVNHKRLNIPWCRELHIDRGAEDFCSMAERRTDG